MTLTYVPTRVKRLFFKVHGSWNDWTPWTKCSRPCNTGDQKRKRSCLNPEPAYGGLSCDEGHHLEFQDCNLKNCLIVIGKHCNFSRHVPFQNDPSTS
jgi:hypothetical protein